MQKSMRKLMQKSMQDWQQDWKQDRTQAPASPPMGACDLPGEDVNHPAPPGAEPAPAPR